MCSGAEGELVSEGSLRRLLEHGLAARGPAAVAHVGQLRHAATAAGRSGRAAALMRAAEALHDGDDLDDVLRRLCTEAAAGLGVARAVVWRGGTAEGLTAVSSAGFDTDVR